MTPFAKGAGRSSARRSRLGAVTATSDRAVATFGSSALLVTQVLARVWAVLFLAVATRLLAPTEYSSFAVAANVLAIASLIADFGTSRVVTREVASGTPSPDVLQETAWVAGLLGVATAAGAALFGIVAYAGETELATVVVAAATPAHAILTSFFGALDGSGRLVLRSTMTFALNVSVAIGGLAAVVVFESAFAAVAVMAVSPWAILFVTGVLMRRMNLWRIRPAVRLHRAVEFLRAALPFAALSGVAVIYTRFDLLILSKAASPVATSNYDAAVRVVEGLAFPSTVLASVALVLLARRLGNQDTAGAQRVLDRIAWAATTSGLMLGGLAFGLAEPLADLLLGAQFAGSEPLIRVLALQVPLLFVANAQGAVVGAGHTMRHAVALGLVLLGLIVVADLIAVPHFGAPGAAWTTVAVQLLNVGLYNVRNRRVLGLHFGAPRMGALAAAAVTAGIAVLTADDLGVLAVAPAAGAGAVTLWVTGALRRDDVEFLTGVLRLRSYQSDERA
jgi:O-antigen/teichoic acid export membrane protein